MLNQTNIKSEAYVQIMTTVWDSLLESLKVFAESRT